MKKYLFILFLGLLPIFVCSCYRDDYDVFEWWIENQMNEPVNIKFYWYDYSLDTCLLVEEYDIAEGESVQIGGGFTGDLYGAVAAASCASLTIGDTVIYYGHSYGLTRFANRDIYKEELSTTRVDHRVRKKYIYTLTLTEEFLSEYPGDVDSSFRRN